VAHGRVFITGAFKTAPDSGFFGFTERELLMYQSGVLTSIGDPAAFDAVPVRLGLPRSYRLAPAQDLAGAALPGAYAPRHCATVGHRPSCTGGCRPAARRTLAPPLQS
jgi:hypothetical protein